MRSAFRAETVLLSRRWPELLFLALLAAGLGLYRAISPDAPDIMGILTNQRLALLPFWALSEVVFRSRQGRLGCRTAILFGHSRSSVFRAKLFFFLLLTLALDALSCAVALVSAGCFSWAVLPLLLLRVALDTGFSSAFLLCTQLPIPNAPLRHVLNGGCALALGVVGGLSILPMVLSVVLLLSCPALSWLCVRRCEL